MLTNADFLSPLAIFLVKRGGNGDRVLFRYPYLEPIKKMPANTPADAKGAAKASANGAPANGAVNGVEGAAAAPVAAENAANGNAR